MANRFAITDDDIDRYDFDDSDSDRAELDYSVREELDDENRADAVADERDEQRAIDLFGFPVPPVRDPQWSAYAYGAILLSYVLASDVDVFGLLSDEDLALVDHAAGYAVSAPTIAPIAVDRISAIRHAIARILKDRRSEAPTVRLPIVVDGKPNAGPMAPLEPAPIVRPPSGQKVEVNF